MHFLINYKNRKLRIIALIVAITMACSGSAYSLTNVNIVYDTQIVTAKISDGLGARLDYNTISTGTVNAQSLACAAETKSIGFTGSSGYFDVVRIDNMEKDFGFATLKDTNSIKKDNSKKFKGDSSAKASFIVDTDNLTVSYERNLTRSTPVAGRALKFMFAKSDVNSTAPIKLSASVKGVDNVWYDLPYFSQCALLNTLTSDDLWYSYCEMIPSNVKNIVTVRINVTLDEESIEEDEYTDSLYFDDVTLVESGKYIVDNMEGEVTFERLDGITSIEKSDVISDDGLNSILVKMSSPPDQPMSISKKLNSAVDAAGKYLEYSMFIADKATANILETKAYVKDIDGNWVELNGWFHGFTNQSVIGYSGDPKKKNGIYEGWQRYREQVPVDTKPITEIRIEFSRNGTSNTTVNAQMFIDSVNFSQSYPFSSGEEGNYNAYMSDMWRSFGSTSDGYSTVNKYGGAPTWFEFIHTKLGWTDEENYIRGQKNILRDCGISDDGYLWSWGSTQFWPSDRYRHFDGIPEYILGLYRIISYDGTSFLNEVDNDITAEGDVSKGLKVIDKARIVMNYMLTTLNGASGVLTIDNGMNTGIPVKETGVTNYWDNIRFGYKDGYTNTFFYPAVKAMSEIERAAGDIAKSDYYLSLLPKIKSEYNKTFWDPIKGRYIGWIDANGVKYDYGFTSLNLQAVGYGLASNDQAKSVLDWLDGVRIVSGDDSTGKADIYKYGFASRTNTKKLTADVWWDAGNQSIEGSGSFGQIQSNGGAILYYSYYDLLTRLNYNSADDALDRLNGILAEYDIDYLRRDPLNDYNAAWLVGVVGEFPESGLVPYFHVKGFVGADADYEKLIISPNVPTSMKFASVSGFNYKNRVFNIYSQKDQVTLQTDQGTDKTLKLQLNNFTANTYFYVTNTDLINGIATVKKVKSDANGSILIEEAVGGNRRIEISK